MSVTCCDSCLNCHPDPAPPAACSSSGSIAADFIVAKLLHSATASALPTTSTTAHNCTVGSAGRLEVSRPRAGKDRWVRQVGSLANRSE